MPGNKCIIQSLQVVAVQKKSNFQHFYFAILKKKKKSATTKNTNSSPPCQFPVAVAKLQHKIRMFSPLFQYSADKMDQQKQ